MGVALLVWPARGATRLPASRTIDPQPSTAYASNPPLGHTGGFGEPTCQACHSDAELNHPDAALTVEGFPDRYAAGVVYRFTVAVTGFGQGRTGFQASTRFAAGPQRGLQAGRLSATDLRVLVISDSLTSVQYAAHSDLGADLVGPERGEWVLEWAAPASGESVVMHVSGNSANGDDSPFGDLIHTLEQVSTSARARPSR